VLLRICPFSLASRPADIAPKDMQFCTKGLLSGDTAI
jgi:hypothetical protein